MVSFDLTSEPWIPCERLDGHVVELSTRDALVQAHEVRGIVDSSPLVVAALYRHLLAVLHRAYDGPATERAWCDIARSERFDGALVEAYLERVRERMDLFHPETPFAQVRGLAAQFNVDPVDQLTIERSSWGTARSLFQHRPAGYHPSMTFAEAARGLLAHQAFATGGLVKKPGEPVSATAAPLVRAAMVLLRGKTLFHTLLSNLLIYDPKQGLPVPVLESDKPSWEQPPQPTHLRVSEEPKRVPCGWLDMLTWLSRRLELVVEGNVVTGYVRAVGQGMADASPRDPMVAYYKDDKRGWVSFGLSKDRAFWRNAHALFEAARDESNRIMRPLATSLIARPAILRIWGGTSMYSVNVFGISAEKSRVDLVREEHMHVMARAFGDPDARENVEAALLFAEQAVKALRSALWTYARYGLSPGAREPEGKDKTALVDSIGAVQKAWDALGVAFDGFLRGLGVDARSAREDFERSVLYVVRDRFRAATRGDDSTRLLKARAVAELVLHRELRALERSEAQAETVIAEENPA